MSKIVACTPLIDRENSLWFSYGDLLTFSCAVLSILANVTTLRSLYAIAIPSVVCRLWSVVDVGAPYSGG